MTDKYFAPLGDEPTPLDSFEDEFTGALRAQPDTAVTESWAARAASLPRLIRRRRTARVTGSIAASVALVLGATLAVAQIPTSVTTPPPPPANLLPAPEGQPLEMNCTTTLTDVLEAPAAVNGFALTDFLVGDAGQVSAVLNGPDSTSATVDEQWPLAGATPANQYYDPAGLGALWFPLDAADTAGSDAVALDPTTTAEFGTFPFSHTTHPRAMSNSEKRSVQGGGLQVDNELLAPCPDTDDPSSWTEGWPTTISGTYAVVGFGYVRSPDSEGRSGSSAQALVAARTAIVSVTDGTVTVLSLSPRSGAIDAPTDTGYDGAAAQQVEPFTRADGKSLTFENQTAAINMATEIDPPAADPDRPVPNDREVELVQKFDTDNGLWFARRTTERTDDLQPWHTQWGTWSSADQFEPWRDTQEISASDARWSPYYAVDQSNPAQVAWLESDGIQTTAGPFWIFAADALGDNNSRLIVGPDDTADNALDGHQLAIFNGRVYWDERPLTGSSSEHSMVRSASLTGDPDIRTEALGAERPVASADGVWVTTIAPDTQSPIGIGKLSGYGFEPFLTFTDPGQDATDVSVSESAIALNIGDTIYVVPFDLDQPVWSVAVEENSLTWFNYQEDQLTWNSEGKLVYVATPWRSDEINYYRP
ncbi:hypothetical protein SAMN06309944_1368 [Micrococcales bacterium KH10]|nr:hypothetical protein SAMN06309944_1368 [Micrococcales bacterium KH10]